MSRYFSWPSYVPVAERRAQALRKVEKLRKKGQKISPVTIEGKTIAKSFWGKAWCDNLESYSDYENRLPRGRSYVRNGSVIDLQINAQNVTAMVYGSDVYNIRVDITPVSPEKWAAICRDCAGSIGSLIELLQGRLSKSVMERVCRKGDGLFPSPQEIKISCNCPDWAVMCKHVAAALYGVGARLDEKPELLFRLRSVNESDLISKASARLSKMDAPTPTSRALADDDISALFGIHMDEENNETQKPRRVKKKAVKKPRKTKKVEITKGSKIKPAPKRVKKQEELVPKKSKKQITTKLKASPPKKAALPKTKASNKKQAK